MSGLSRGGFGRVSADALSGVAGGFQIGIQISVAQSVEEVWRLLVERPDLWLGRGGEVVFEQGRRYALATGPAGGDEPGVSGEIRAVRPGYRLRLTWQPADWTSSATVQLTLLEGRAGKTALHAHLERLPDAETQQSMRSYWRALLERLAAAGE